MHKQIITDASTEDCLFFKDFYKDYRSFMMYVAQLYIQSQPDCEDLVHDATLRLMRHIPTLKKLNSAKTAKYIEVTIRTTYFDLYRRRKVEQHFLNELMKKYESKGMVCIAPDNNVFTKIRVNHLKCRMTNRDWCALECKYILGFSYEELAIALNVNPANARSIVHRAKERARQILSLINWGDDTNG